MVLRLWPWESSTLPGFFSGLVSNHKPLFFLVLPPRVHPLSLNYQPLPYPMSLPWSTLLAIAQEESQRLISEFPPALRTRVLSIPITFEALPTPALVADGVDPDLMGLFVGDDYAHPGLEPLPTQVLLFLRNIYDEAEGDMDRYRQEVRITLLHEIGHFLGLDEDDLWQRDLE